MNVRATEAATLAEVGAVLRASAPPPVQVHLAGALALIGLAISDHGRWTGDQVVVPLPVELAGVAMDSVDA
jgi:hypothetical protein